MSVDAMLKMLGPEGNRIGACFRQISIAEEEIRSFLDENPDLKKETDERFKQLRSPMLEDKPEGVFRLHVKELLGRLENGTRFDLGTKAEVMVALSDLSLKAPLDRDAQALFEEIFVEAFGSLPFFGRGPMEFSYKHARHEVLSKIAWSLRELTEREE